MKTRAIFMSLFILALTGCSIYPFDRDDPEKWLADFDALKTALDGWEHMPQKGGNPFPAGRVRLADGRYLGVIYIRYFGEDRYRSIAEPEWDAYAATIEGDCDGWCLWRFRYPVRARLMEMLQERLDELDAAGMDVLAVDITRNGGGTEWADDVARFFAAGPLRCARFSFVKHAHWERALERNLETVDEDLARDDISQQVRTLLTEAHDRIETMLDHTRAGCDRGALWLEPDAQLTCSLLSEDLISSCGLYAYLDEPDIAELESSWILHSPLRSSLPTAAYTGPLVVVVDRHTASASEQFATLLQLNGAAVIMGEPTVGAGCGYTSGGISTYLPNVGLRVRMSDCVRYRADGENELAGIEPDVSLWEDGDDGRVRARKLVDAIGTP